MSQMTDNRIQYGSQPGPVFYPDRTGLRQVSKTQLSLPSQGHGTAACEEAASMAEEAVDFVKDKIK